jgi:hypothetical protein
VGESSKRLFGVADATPLVASPLAAGGTWRAAHDEAFAVLLDLGVRQRIQIGDNLGPEGRAAERGDAVSRAFLNTGARKLQNTWPRTVSSCLWKIGRVAKRCLAVRKLCSAVHGYL